MKNDKSIQKQDKNVPKKSTSTDHMKRLLLDFEAEIDPSVILRQIDQDIDDYEDSTGKKKSVAKEKLLKNMQSAYPIVELDNHYMMAEAMYDKRYQTFAVELADQLNTEYACRTTSEKMLAETAAWAYARMLEYSSALTALRRAEYLSAEKNGYYGLMSKEIDRANRQFLTAVSTLRQMKQPKVTVNFKAHNAFVAQTQQINAKQDKVATEVIDAEQ